MTSSKVQSENSATMETKSFSNFVVGAGNRAAVTACKQLMLDMLIFRDKYKKGGFHFNHLYFESIEGTGKTHLLLALRDFLTNAGFNVFYAKRTDYTRNIVMPSLYAGATYEDKATAFLQQYRADIYLFDDGEDIFLFPPPQEFLFAILKQWEGRPILLAANTHVMEEYINVRDR